MKTILVRFILPCALILTAACQSMDNTKRSEATERKTDERRDQIEMEIARLEKHTWAGEYYQGDGLGMNIAMSIAPKNGFAFSWHGCLGLYDQNYGAVVETNGFLKLTFALPNERGGFRGLAREFIPVHWGPRTYLVASDEIADFCNDVNSGREPRNDMHGRHLLRDGDEKKRANGEPEIPAQFRQYLLKKPITANIVAVGKVSTRPSIVEFKFKDIEVTLDAGKKDGLLPGMELRVISNNAFDSVKITRVEENQAFGRITQIGEDDPMPQVGWKFSTER